MEETRIDMRDPEQADFGESMRCAELCFKINHTMVMTDEYNQAVKKLFLGNIGENSMIVAPFNCERANNIKIGNNVSIMFNCVMMGAGGITIDDDVAIAANAQLLSNGHDFHDRMILTCKPIHICQNAWLGAGATIMPGVTVGKNAIVAAGAIVTKDVPDNAVVAGIPAKVIKMID